MALAGDGSVILAGSTTGVWSEHNIGLKDFAASKLDSDGNLVWTWQVNCDSLLYPVGTKLLIVTGGRGSIDGIYGGRHAVVSTVTQS